MKKRIGNTRYFTLFKFEPDLGRWFDEFGSFDLDEVRGEVEFAHYDAPRKNLRIVRHLYGESVPEIALQLYDTGLFHPRRPLKTERLTA